MKDKLISKIDDKTLKVGIVGLGYVGLPLAVEFANAGYKTIGFDMQNEKVNKVNSGENYIGDIVPETLKRLVAEKMLTATTDWSKIKELDFIAICVPTPLDEYQQPDVSYITSSTETIGKYLSKETMVVLESTTYPGTTEDLVKPILEGGSGLTCSKDFYLGFSPERVDPGNAVYKTKNTPKIVGAIGNDANICIAKVYNHVLDSDVKTVSSPAIAEMEKILENTYRNINIGLVNEMAIICNRMGINIWEVIEAAKTKPYGFQAFYPGPGLGGHCIPLDPFYLTWKAREFNYHTKLIETSGEINTAMPEYIVERSSIILNKYKKSLNGAKILISGVAYKADIDDYRESPSLRVIEEFEKYGSIITAYDPYIKEYKYKGKIHKCVIGITDEDVKNYDLVVITTDHKAVDYEMLNKNSKFIFDTRNAMKNIERREKIELL